MDAVAIARPYAAAAFQFAREENSISEWQATLAHMAQAMTAVNALAAEGALVSEAQAAEVALAAAEKGGKVSDTQKRFLTLLAENERVKALPAIYERFETLRMDDAGIVAVHIESAMPIKDQKGFNKHLEERLGKQVQATYSENSDLLGGVRVYVEDDVIDNSIRGRLDKLSTALTGAATTSS